MSKWKHCKLGDILKFGNGKTRPKTIGDKPIYGGNGILGYTDKQNYENETIIIGRVGAYCGSVYYENRPIWISDNALAAKPKDENNAKFLYYFLKNLNLNQFALGSSHPLITQTLLNSIEIEICEDPDEQKAIAAVLSSLDDKIGLLHRQNKTLEALAETLFRQWFIEEAQDDWEKGTLGDLIELIYGKGLKKSERTGTGFPVVGSSGIVDFHSEYLVKGPGIVIGRKGTLGKTIFIEENFYPIDTTYYVKSRGNTDDLYFEYFLLKNIDFEELNTDSAVPGLNRNIALSVELKIPPVELIDQFNKFTKHIFEKRRNNKSQIHTLEKLRETLLPKLMSGEVRVKITDSAPGKSAQISNVKDE